MKKYRVLLCSRPDGASESIAEFLREKYDFSESGDLPGTFTFRDFILVYSDERHLYLNTLRHDLATMGIEPEDVVFLSKHSSAAGIKSLTVHTPGNFGKAELGGEEGRLSMSDPSRMTSSLRLLAANPLEKFSTTFEATHHGPLTDIPSYFIEIGTSETEWKDPEALSNVAKAIVESKSNMNDTFVGVGGGHYCPKITDYVLENSCNVGHIISKHSHNDVTPELIAQAVKNTPECRGFIMDRKGSRGPVRQMVREAVNERGLELILL